MKPRVAFQPMEHPVAGRCPYCSAHTVLTHTIVLYFEFSVNLCRACWVTISRHERWRAEAGARHRENLREKREAVPLPTP